MKILFYYISAAVLILYVWNCRSNKTYIAHTPGTSDAREEKNMEVNSVAFHAGDSLTKVYFEVLNDFLLYRRPDTSASFYAMVKVSYKLYADRNSKKIIDSSSFYLTDFSKDEAVMPKSLTSEFNLKATTGKSYYMEMETTDLNKKTKHKSSLVINKQNKYNRQNFLITAHGHVTFKNHLLKNGIVSIRCNDSKVEQLDVFCYIKETGAAPPPFVTKINDELKPRPDSTFILKKENGRFELSMPETGFYFIRTNSNPEEGITLHTFDSSFPGVSNSEEMVNCTRYIMSKAEYEECKNASDKKATIDKFWLYIGGSHERARELIKRYYTRVTEANKYFTHYAQGWKSDRGMIFIVFGQPTNLYKSKTDEVWVYGNDANPASLRFVFERQASALSENDYVLERSQFYRDAYFQAVDYWRQGTVFIENKK